MYKLFVCEKQTVNPVHPYMGGAGVTKPPGSQNGRSAPPFWRQNWRGRTVFRHRDSRFWGLRKNRKIFRTLSRATFFGTNVFTSACMSLYTFGFRSSTYIVGLVRNRWCQSTWIPGEKTGRSEFFYITHVEFRGYTGRIIGPEGVQNHISRAQTRC